MPSLQLRSLLVFPLLLAASAWGQVSPVYSPDGKPLSQRVVAYWIDASVNTDAKTLDANEIIEYRNPSDTARFHHSFSPLPQRFPSPIHLFQRVASRRHGHLLRQGRARLHRHQEHFHRGLRRRFTRACGSSLRTTAIRTTIPSWKSPFPNRWRPHEVVRLQLAFHDKFPLSVARNGYKRDFIMGAQWFPKVGVLWHGEWNCHQYHADTEFFSDFGTYNVNLTLPQRYIVGASGIQTAEQANSDGTRTLSFRGEDIHDFAWAASPHFQVVDDVFVNSLGPVKLHGLVLASHANQRDRYLVCPETDHAEIR